MRNSYTTKVPRGMSHSVALFPAIVIAVLILSQTGCFFHKKKLPAAPPVPVQPARIAVLPLNTPPEDAELRWLSLGADVVMAKVVQNAESLELMPLWESVPLAIDTLGTSRSLTPDQAASIASRMAAKWAVCGEITPAKSGINLLLDFVPAKETGIPFRFEKQLSPDAMEGAIREAFEQFLRYLVAKPIGKGELSMPDEDLVRSLADALDVEYGWNASADPGKSEKLIATLAQSDAQLASALFNPTIYPVLNRTPAKEEPPKKTPPADKPQSSAKPAPSPPESPPVPAVVPALENKALSDPPTGADPAPPTISAAEIPVQHIPGNQTLVTAEKPTPVFPLAGRTQTGRYTPAQPAPPAPVAEAEPPPKPSPAPKPAARTATAEPSRSFAIQVFSSTSKETADLAIARLRKAGLNAEIARVDLGDKGTWYRIRLQNYSSRAEAVAEGERLRSSGLIKEYWVVR
jgi:cell division septation protein DedD